MGFDKRGSKTASSSSIGRTKKKSNWCRRVLKENNKNYFHKKKERGAKDFISTEPTASKQKIHFDQKSSTSRGKAQGGWGSFTKGVVDESRTHEND